MADVAPWESRPADPAAYALQGLKFGAEAASQNAAIAKAIADQRLERDRLNANIQMERMRLGATSAEAAARTAESARQFDLQLGMDQAKLEEASRRSDLQYQLDLEKLEQEKLAEAQRLEISKAYREIQTQLQRDRLAETKRVNQEKTDRAAKQYAAWRAIAAASQTPGADVQKAFFSALPELNPPPEAAFNMIQKTTPVIPENVKTFERDGQKFFAYGGNVRPITSDNTMVAIIKSENNHDLDLINELEKQFLLTEDKKIKESTQAKIDSLKARVEERKRRLSSLEKGGSGGSGDSRPFDFDYNLETGKFVPVK